MWVALGPAPPSLEELRRLFPPGPRRSQVLLRGALAAAPQARRAGQWVALVRPEGPPGRFGLIRLTIAGEPPEGPWAQGVHLRVPVKLHRPEPANPGEPPFAGVCPEGRLSALGWVSARDLQVEDAEDGGNPVLLRGAAAAVDAAKRRFASFLERGNRETGQGILKALVLGEKHALTGETAEDFARAGAMHLLVVSGLHLSIVAAALGEAAHRLRLGRRASCALTTAGVAFYASLTGWTPPVTRAALMALSAQGARLVGRPHDVPRALWLAAGLMLVQRPLLFFDAGFRLSVAATWGVTALGPGLAAKLGLEGALGRGFAAALGAQLATVPLVLQYFGRLPVTALAASPLLVEGGALLTEAGFTLGALALVVPPLAAPLASGLGVGAEVLHWAAKAAGALPWATVNLPGGPDWLALSYYAALTIWWRIGLRAGEPPAAGDPASHRFRVRLTPLATPGGAAALAGLVGVTVFAGRSPWLNCTFLSVGEGDALHLRLPGGLLAPHLMVDAGPSAGQVRDYLRRAAVQSVAGVVVTHLHRDHIGGLAGLRQVGPVGKVIAPGNRGYRAETLGGVQVLVTGAPAFGDVNEASRRVLVRHGRFVLLSTGDAPLRGDDPVLAGLPRRSSPEGQKLFFVVKVPHHGARGSLDPAFLAAWRPDLAVISVGPNAYGHPHPELLSLLRRHGIPVWRTDQGGALRVETDGRRVRLRGFSRGGAGQRAKSLEIAHHVRKLDVGVKGGVQPAGQDLGHVVDEQVDLAGGDDQTSGLGTQQLHQLLRAARRARDAWARAGSGLRFALIGAIPRLATLFG